jgi:hypothetical protein
MSVSKASFNINLQHYFRIDFCKLFPADHCIQQGYTTNIPSINSKSILAIQTQDICSLCSFAFKNIMCVNILTYKRYFTQGFDFLQGCYSTNRFLDIMGAYVFTSFTAQTDTLLQAFGSISASQLKQYGPL